MIFTSNPITLIEKNKPGRLRKVLRKSPDLVKQKFNGETLLIIASYINSSELCEILIEAGSSPLEKGKDDLTPIHIAAVQGCLSSLKVLCEHTTEVDPIDNVGFTPLFYAIRSREQDGVETAQYLINQGANYDLNCASCLGDITRINYLLDQDDEAVIKCKFPKELILDYVSFICGAIWDEAELGCTEPEADKIVLKYLPTLERLLSSGCSPNDRDISWPPLFEAVQMESLLVAECLLKNGAEVSYERDGEIQTAMEIATFRRPRMQALLKEYGA